MAALSCSSQGGAELVSVGNFEDALAARDAMAGNATDLVESFRLDAQHNETCFTNANGDEIELGSSGFNVDLPLEVDNPQVLVINEDTGDITAEEDDATVGTVCQYSMTSPEPTFESVKTEALV